MRHVVAGLPAPGGPLVCVALHETALRVRSCDQRRGTRGGVRAGAVRPADHRAHPLPLRGTVPVPEAQRPGAGAGPPGGVSAAVQYGPRITVIILYLYVGQFLSKKRTAAALAELFGTPVSEGTVAAMSARAAAGLGGVKIGVRAKLAAADAPQLDD